MKTITLFILLLVASFNANAQSTIFEDSFESYTNFAITGVGAWTLTDVDGAIAYPSGTFTFPNYDVPKSFQVFDPTSGVSVTLGVGWTARTGTKSMTCFNAIPTPTITANNDWLISPQMTLGTSNSISFWAKASDLTYFAEKFNVSVSNTNTSVASFVKISPSTVAQPYVTMVSPAQVWYQFTYTIPTTYDNAPVYIAIQCVSDDMFGFLVDDFKVTGTVACSAPSAGTAVVTGLSAALSWTTAGAFDVSEIKVQLAGAGTPSAANNTGVAVSGTTYTEGGLTANTNYEFWVRDECTDGVLFSAWSGPFLFNTLAVPNCVTLTSPANAATAINNTVAIPLTWTASTTGAPASSYDVYVGTTAVLTTLTSNVTTLTYSYNGALPGTTYFWKVIAKNAGGGAIGCTNFTFITTPSAFSPYCGPVTYANDLEPITGVTFAGIAKTYPNTIVPAATAVHHKIFTDVATVAQSASYPIVLKGNTGGNFTTKYVVFVDWNQNGVLNDAGEVYFDVAPLVITNSTGLDAASVTGNIIVPATAATGNTRMRIKKMYTTLTAIPAGFIDPCISLTTGGTYGEMHDYNVNVTTPLATDTFSSVNFKSFPNPVINVLNMSYDKNITSVSVMNLLGQVVVTNAIDNKEAIIDMSGLTTGTYMVKVTSDHEVKTIKVIKE
jgi:hypothetical protein